MAFDGIRREMRALRGAEPGRRFQDGHARHRVANVALRLTLIAIGCTVVVLGAAAFWLPGPQVVVVLAGLAIVAAQWALVARSLDRGELAGRRWKRERWDPSTRKGLFAAALFVAVVAIVAIVVWLLAWVGLVDLPL